MHALEFGSTRVFLSTYYVLSCVAQQIHLSIHALLSENTRLQIFFKPLIRLVIISKLKNNLMLSPYEK